MHVAFQKWRVPRLAPSPALWHETPTLPVLRWNVLPQAESSDEGESVAEADFTLA